MNDSTAAFRRQPLLSWLLGTSAGALLAAILFPIFRFVSPPEIAEAGTNEVEGGVTNDPELLLAFGNATIADTSPVILVRVAEGDFCAFAGTCTHLDCIVEFHKDQKRIWCNCHNGEYNLHGQRVAGPPPRPLEPFKVDLVYKGAGEPQTIVVSRA